MDKYDSKFDTANLGQVYDQYEQMEDNIYLYNKPSFEYPWYLSIWFIFTLSALSFLIIPGLIAIALIKRREDKTAEINYYFEQLEYQKLEVQKIYNKRDQINKSIEEEQRKALEAIEEKRKTLIQNAEVEAYNIVQSAENQRSQILNEFKIEEDELKRRKDKLAITEERLEKNMENLIRKLNLFCHNINDFRKTASPEQFKEKYVNKGVRTDSDNSIDDNDLLEKIENLGTSNDDISNTLKIRNNNKNN
ncbi:MAG: hypothetical protein Q4P31_04025 [Andreesenia angusta]|nr:hypothetical protein [Andreesenia angusta]